MKVWQDYALIQDSEVKNVACFHYGEYTQANQLAVALYGEGAFAVDVTQIPTQVGDTYSNGTFYREGVEVGVFPTEEQQIAQNTADIASANDAIDELIIAITPTNETEE